MGATGCGGKESWTDGIVWICQRINEEIRKRDKGEKIFSIPKR